MSRPDLLAIFVGGQSKRMGGRPKGLLPVDEAGTPVVRHLCEAGREAGLLPVLVGNRTEYDDILEIPRIADATDAVGPLAGILAALRYASAHGHRHLVTVACDMPHINAAYLRLLSTQKTAEQSDVVSARRSDDGPYEPFFARWTVATALSGATDYASSGQSSLQGLLRALRTVPLSLAGSNRQALDDWDEPGDLPDGSQGEL